jgi:hypothetical protein
VFVTAGGSLHRVPTRLQSVKDTFQALAWNTGEYHEKVTATGNPTEIRTGYIPNTSLDRHRYTKLLAVIPTFEYGMDTRAHASARTHAQLVLPVEFRCVCIMSQYKCFTCQVQRSISYHYIRVIHSAAILGY